MEAKSTGSGPKKSVRSSSLKRGPAGRAASRRSSTRANERIYSGRKKPPGSIEEGAAITAEFDDDSFDRAKANTARKIEKSLDATQLYLNEIGYSPLLSPDEEKYFARLARKGDTDGRRRMIESNLRLVVKISRRYINHRSR